MLPLHACEVISTTALVHPPLTASRPVTPLADALVDCQVAAAHNPHPHVQHCDNVRYRGPWASHVEPQSHAEGIDVYRHNPRSIKVRACAA